MHTRLLKVLILGVVLMAIASPAVRAASANSLLDNYDGPGFGANADVNTLFTLHVQTRQGTKFTGLMGLVPVTGKVASNGAVTFKVKFNGALGQQQQAKVTLTLKARLSVDTHQILGNLRIKGTLDGVALDVLYLIHLTDSELRPPMLSGSSPLD